MRRETYYSWCISNGHTKTATGEFAWNAGYAEGFKAGQNFRKIEDLISACGSVENIAKALMNTNSALYQAVFGENK